MSSPRYRLAMFDFDGTLADSFPFFLSVFNTIADRHGFRRIDVSKADALRHLSAREVMTRVGMPAWKLPMVSKTFIALMQDSAAHIRPFAGIPDVLQALHRREVRLAVVSSNSEDNVRRVLGPELAALIGHFECGMSMFGKASRLRTVMRAQQVEPPAAIYIGDHGTDAQAAHKAGIAFGAVSWGYAPLSALRAHAPTLEFGAPSDIADRLIGPQL
ncbi:MAG: HAD hydrolase-like protein [Gammaproteobacteria bacterium]